MFNTRVVLSHPGIILIIADFLCQAEAEADAVDEAGLLVQAAEVTDSIDDFILFLEGFTGHRVVEFIKCLFNLLGIVGADMFVIGIVQEFLNSVGIVTERCLLGGFLCLQGG